MDIRELAKGVHLDLVDLSRRIDEVREDVVEARKSVKDSDALERLARAAAILYSLSAGAADAERRTTRVLAAAVQVVVGKLPAADVLRDEDAPEVEQPPAPAKIATQKPAADVREVLCRCGCGAVFSPKRQNVRFATDECRVRYRKAYKVEYMQSWWAERGEHYNRTRREGRAKE